MRHHILLPVFCYLFLCCLFLATALADEIPKPKADVPQVDGESGPCQVELVTTDIDGKPAGGVKISAHVVHGFLGVRKLDLVVTSNDKGRANFVGLPENIEEPFYFEGAKGDEQGMVFYSPDEKCESSHFLVLHKHLMEAVDSNGDSAN